MKLVYSYNNRCVALKSVSTLQTPLLKKIILYHEIFWHPHFWIVPVQFTH